MRPWRCVPLLLCVLAGAGSTWAYQKAAKSRYTDESYGFTIEPPGFPAAGPGVNSSVVLFTAPPVAGFSSNVTIIAQDRAESRAAYRTLSIGGLKAAGLTVKADRDRTVSGRDAIEFEYEGKIGERAFHFLALAVIDADRVILVTCTATPEGFPGLEAEFRACLDSFKLQGNRT